MPDGPDFRECCARRIVNYGEPNVSQQGGAEPVAGKSEFEELNQGKQLSLVREFWLFIVENKTWWMIPILLVFAILGVLIVLALTGASPFVYI